MKKKLLIAFAVLALAFAVFAVPTVWLKPWSINHFYARVFLSFALRHPMMLSSMRILEPMGLDFHSDDLDDVSMKFQRREAEWSGRQLEMLKSYDRDSMDEAGRLSYDVLTFFLEDTVRGMPFLFHNYPVNQMAGVQSQLPNFMINIHQVNDAGDAEDYNDRLAQFGVFYDQIIEGLLYRRDQGIVPPRFVLTKSLEETRGLIEPPVRENELYVHLEDALGQLEDVGDAKRQEILERTAEVLETVVYPAYERLIEAVEGLEQIATTDDGVWKLPDGEAYYAYQLRHFTTTEMSADEIHRLGLEQVMDIETEMRRILEGEGVEVESLGAAMEDLLHDPRFAHEDSDAGREEILDEFRAILDEMQAGLDPIFNVRPRAALEVKRVPEFKQANSPAAYYTQPSFDGSRPGTFWANLRNVEEHPRFAMRTLAYHEGIPGHHFQLALAQEMEGVPFFRKVIPFTAFVEGWALYAEHVAAENGFQDDPYDRLGYLQAQLFRAVRLVVDTGIHQKRWTREEAIAYMSEHTGMPMTDVVAEVERYIVNPGQACAYKVGQLKILELRERARAELGEKFDLRGFHDVVLTHGAVPLVILEDLVERWVESQKAA